MGREGGGAIEPLEALGAEHRLAEPGEQFGGVVEHRARGIPLEEHKLEIVLRPSLAVTKRMGELVDRP